MTQLIPNGKQYFTDNSGRPLIAGRVYFYKPGTQTPKDTYQDFDLTVLNTNPVILNARGEAQIYGNGAYRMVLTDKDQNQIWDMFIPDIEGSLQDAIKDIYTRNIVQVDSIVELKKLDKNVYKSAQTLGYYSKGDGAGHSYYYDELDTTSVDNGGSVIIANDGGRWKFRAGQEVTIDHFGGRGDGFSDNTIPWQKASASVGVTGVVNFSGATGGRYFFGADPLLSSSIIRSEPGVLLIGPAISLYGAVKVLTPTAVNVTGDQNYTYRMTPEHRKEWADKDLFLTDGDIDRGVLLPILATGMSKVKINFLTSDAFIDATADQTSVSDQVTWNNAPADGIARLATTNVKPGDELSACFLESTVYRRIAIIITTAGYHAVYADGGGGQPHYAIKPKGVAAGDALFDYLGRTTHANMAPENSVWSIKVFDYKTFAVLFNGVEVTGLQKVNGTIISAGFGVVAIGSAQTLHINGFVRWGNKPAGGKRGFNVLTVGDSITADIQGGWPSALREALNGSFGSRILNLDNRAVSGDNSTTQLADLQARGLNSANLVFICIGTNDIQYNAPAATLVANVSAMIDLCLAGFATPIVWIPQTWYLRTNSGGGGQATQNNGNGWDHRVRLMRLCADRGVKCVDMMQVSGPILSNFLSNPDIDPWVRDNIHPTSHAYRVMAFALARAAADVLSPRYDRRMAQTAFVAASASNGWGFTVQQPFYEVSDAGSLSLSGALSNGTITSGTAMYALPANLAPSSTRRFSCQTSSGQCMVAVDTSAVLTLFNPSAGMTWVDLSPINYLL